MVCLRHHLRAAFVPLVPGNLLRTSNTWPNVKSSTTDASRLQFLARRRAIDTALATEKSYRGCSCVWRSEKMAQNDFLSFLASW